MKTVSSSKTNHFLLNSAMFVTSLPWLLLPLFLLGASIGLPMFGSEGAAPLKQWVIPVAAGGLLVLTACVLILWKGRVMTGLAIVGAVIFLLYIHSGTSADPRSDKNLALNLGATSPVRGVDVYCNGVHLGQTPLRIPREELDSRVQPWTQPPRQDRFTSSTAANDNPYFWCRYRWIPSRIFETYEKWPPAYSHITSDKESRKLLTTSRYWWRFEKTGCAASAYLSGMGSGGASSSRSSVEIQLEPQIEYPSIAPHLEALLAALEKSGFQATPEWLAHFRKYQDLLFLEFRRRVDKDARLQPTLDALVRVEFGLPEHPSEKDCERVLEEILRRAEAMGGFIAPSIESAALDLMGDAASPVVVRLFPREMRHSRRGSWGTSGSGGPWVLVHRSGKAARQIPLEYAVKRLCPPELYNLLVYESQRNSDFLALLGNYRRPETIPLVQAYLREAAQKRSPFPVSFEIRNAISLMSRMRNPDLETIFREFLRENVSGKFPENNEAKEYIRSCIGRSDVDQRELASWINHLAPLEEKDKVDFLMRIDCPETNLYLRVLGADRDWQKRNSVIEYAAQNPNPALDQFVIEAYRSGRTPDGQPYISSGVWQALVRMDTPLIRKFINEEWDKRGEEQLNFAKRLTEYSGSCPGLAWMTPKLAEVRDSALCSPAARLLNRIHTPESWAVLEKWANDAANPDAQKAAQAELENWQAGERADAEAARAKLARANDLISGKIKPDDLLPPPTPHVWNGKDYVPESQSAASSG